MVLLLLWVTLDVAAIAFGAPALWSLGRWSLVAGVVAGGLAATAGLTDYVSVASRHPRAMRTASAHLAVMLGVLTVALLALVFRSPVLPEGAVRWLHLAVAALVAGGLAVGGWLGGHLVFRHAVGVDEQ
jgi:uncharacterized membrane protein